jgi:hypothetical protein
MTILFSITVLHLVMQSTCKISESHQARFLLHYFAVSLPTDTEYIARLHYRLLSKSSIARLAKREFSDYSILVQSRFDGIDTQCDSNVNVNDEMATLARQVYMRKCFLYVCYPSHGIHAVC